jgi:glycosyltransferase involved in cell wall biosynthesis
MSLLATHTPPGTTITWQTGNAIAANRNVSIREMQGDWVWFIDDDHVWDSKLLFALLERNVDIVVPICAMRYHPFCPNVFSGPDGRGGYTALSWTALAQHRGLLKVFAMGTAGMLIRKRVIERMTDPWFEVGRANPEGLWEDAWFCKKAHEAGFEIHADLDQMMGHISRLVFWPKLGGVEVEIAESGLRIPLEMP